jgi:hypothetical protein
MYSTIETKLPRNDHWKVLYKIYVFYVDRKSKMATTAIHRLTLDPMGKCSTARAPGFTPGFFVRSVLLIFLVPEISLTHKYITAQKVSDFLFKTIRAICQLYHGENKLHFDDDDSKHLNTV